MLQKIEGLINPVKQHPILGAGLALVLATSAIIRRQQYRLLYLPEAEGMPRSPSKNQSPNKQPSQYQELAYQNLEIKTEDDVTLRGWYIFHRNMDLQGDRLILYFQEKSGNIGSKLPFIKQMVQRTNSNVMIIAYRGYSDSEGSPSEAGLKKDGTAILNKAIQISKRKRIPLIVYGRDLGGAVAIHTCSQHINQSQIKGLILQNTFTSISDVIYHKINFTSSKSKFFMKLPLLLLQTNHWQSIKLIGLIRSPVFFIKAEKDKVTPKQQMDQLQRLCQAQNSQYVVRNGTHDETWILEIADYFFEFKNYLRSL